MDDLISRSALLQDIEESIVFSGRSDETSAEMRGAHKVVDRIKAAPTVDAVEVVRCRECKNYKLNKYSGEDDMWCMCWSDWLPTEPDDFCSYGERRSE